jgi:hypothetical protein
VRQIGEKRKFRQNKRNKLLKLVIQEKFVRQEQADKAQSLNPKSIQKTARKYKIGIFGLSR